MSESNQLILTYPIGKICKRKQCKNSVNDISDILHLRARRGQVDHLFYGADLPKCSGFPTKNFLLSFIILVWTVPSEAK